MKIGKSKAVDQFDPMTPKCYICEMADVKIRNLEPYIVEAFKIRAKSAGRSLEAELRETLAEVLEPSRKEAKNELARLRAKIFERVMAMDTNGEAMSSTNSVEHMRDTHQIWREL
jgi:plasmid stability protein